MAKRRRSNQPKPPEKGFLFLDPVRGQVFKWGLIAGFFGGIPMLRPELFWQIIGVIVVVLVANHHINKASLHIPRWQATLYSFLGVTLAIVSVMVLGALVTAFFFSPGAAS